MSEAPHAPWALRGEVVLAWAWRPPTPSAPLPEGVLPLPGPVAVVGVRYTVSPVGPYLELAVAQPARLGLRPGLCVTTSVVSEPAARVGYRLNWGVPAEVGRLSWSADADDRVLRWEDRGVEMRVHGVGPRFPAVVPTRSVQRRGDGPVVVPRRLAALLRFARTAVVVPVDDPLAWLAGPHPGALLSAARMLVRPARHPSGLLSSFRAPLRAAEPGLSYRGPATGGAGSSAAAEALQ